MIEELIETLVKDPTEENKSNYLKFVEHMQYALIQDAHTFPLKSQEYFDRRKQAFAYKRECAKMLLTKWVLIHSSTDNCPVKYMDTLNIPFQEIKVPK